MNPTISCNALEGITTPKILKIEVYIIKKKVIVLIDSGGNHNFIHSKISKELNYFLYPAPECQVMVSNGGTINYSQKFSNVVFIDYGSTYNFIHCKIAKELNFVLYLAPECQVMVANGGTINFSGK